MRPQACTYMYVGRGRHARARARCERVPANSAPRSSRARDATDGRRRTRGRDDMIRIIINGIARARSRQTI
eukprot:COSAG02_NODE_1506_length_12232_cov_420.616088_11_plen_71_part_00